TYTNGSSQFLRIEASAINLRVVAIGIKYIAYVKKQRGLKRALIFDKRQRKNKIRTKLHQHIATECAVAEVDGAVGPRQLALVTLHPPQTIIFCFITQYVGSTRLIVGIVNAISVGVNREIICRLLRITTGRRRLRPKRTASETSDGTKATGIKIL